MATDATGTPTSPDSIPTYNTSADAPSGLGFNAAMAAIQTGLSGRVLKNIVTTAGDLLYATGASTLARLGVGSNGQVLTVVGGAPAWGAASGTEVAYAQITASVPVSTHTSATATTVVTAPAFTADGVSSYLIDFFAPYVSNNTASGETIVELYDGSTELGAMAVLDHPTSGLGAFVRAAVRVTPTAASHTYSARAWTQNPQTANFSAGSGGLAGAAMPAFLRITKI